MRKIWRQQFENQMCRAVLDWRNGYPVAWHFLHLMKNGWEYEHIILHFYWTPNFKYLFKPYLRNRQILSDILQSCIVHWDKNDHATLSVASLSLLVEMGIKLPPWGSCLVWVCKGNVWCWIFSEFRDQLCLIAVFFNRGSAEPKGSMSARQGFCRWPVKKNKNKAKINNKVTGVTSNLSYSDHTSLFLICATITVLHTYNCINQCFCANYLVHKNAVSVRLE